MGALPPYPASGQAAGRGPRPLPRTPVQVLGPPKAARRRFPLLRLRALARAVANLLSCQKRAWRRGVEAGRVQDAFAAMRTLGGAFRLRNLPMCPLTTFADQGARNEISAIAPGLWQGNWRGAERVAELEALRIDRVISVLPRAEAGENPFPPSFRYHYSSALAPISHQPKRRPGRARSESAPGHVRASRAGLSGQ